MVRSTDRRCHQVARALLFAVAGLATPWGCGSPPPPATEIQLVAQYLPGNRFDVHPGELESAPNPHGEGHFVWVARTSFGGVERKFAWFVKGNKAAKLNGATNQLTPGLPFPREAATGFLQDTGLDAGSCTEVGLQIAFGM